LILPEGLVVLAAAALLRWPTLLDPMAPFLPALPVLAFGLGAALAVRFGRGRVLLAVLVLAIADRALGSHPVLGDAVGLFVPLNLAALGLLPERGILTAATGRRAAALAVQVILMVLLARPEEAELVTLLQATLLPAAFSGWTPLADPPLLASGLALVLLAVLFVRKPNATARGLFWALVATVLALSAPPGGATDALAPSTFLFAAGGLVLTTAVIETSHAMAYRDGLTGLPSRRALDEALRGIEGGYTLAMVDVDHFKRCNDTYGHEVGDQVLRMVATALARVTGGGRAFRYGGEEFAVLFPDRDLERCLPALEALRSAVEQTAFTLRGADRPRKRPRKPARRGRKGRQVAVTVSIGVAQRTPAHLPSDEVVRAADEALYRAKHGGRNRIEGGHGRSRTVTGSSRRS
jgi:diguanylate cyclase (GGDEF)-like protein